MEVIVYEVIVRNKQERKIFIETCLKKEKYFFKMSHISFLSFENKVIVE